MKFIVAIFFIAFFYQCNVPELNTTTKDNCYILNTNNKLIDSLLLSKNVFANNIIDSFINCMYANNYKKRFLRNGSSLDSISFLCLDIKCAVMVMPYTDSSTYGIMVTVTDSACTTYYDSILNVIPGFKRGIRFSIKKQKIEYLLSAKSEGLSDYKEFMNIKDILRAKDFRAIVIENEKFINSRFRKFLIRNQII